MIQATSFKFQCSSAHALTAYFESCRDIGMAGTTPDDATEKKLIPYHFENGCKAL
jgi:hypothetical protein